MAGEGPIIGAFVRGATRAAEEALPKIVGRGAADQAVTETARLTGQQGARTATGTAATDSLGAAVPGQVARPGAAGALDALPAPGAAGQVAAKTWPQDAFYSAGEILDEFRQATSPSLARGAKGEEGLRSVFADNATWNKFVDAVGSSEDPQAVQQFIGNMLNKRTPQGMQHVTQVTSQDVARAAGAADAVRVSNEARGAANELVRGVGGSAEARAFGDQLKRPGLTLEQANQARQVVDLLAPFADRYGESAREVLKAAGQALERGEPLDTVLARAQTLTERMQKPARMGHLNNASPADQRRLTQAYMQARDGGEDAVLGVTHAPPPDSAAAKQAAARAPAAPTRPAAPGAGQAVEIPKAVLEAKGGDIPADVSEVLPKRAQERLAGLSPEVREAFGKKGGWAHLYELAQHDPDRAAQLVYELNRNGADAVPGTLRIADFARSHNLDVGGGYWSNNALPAFVTREIGAGTPTSQALSELTPLVGDMTAQQRTSLYQGLVSGAPAKGPARTDYLDAVNAWWRSVR